MRKPSKVTNALLEAIWIMRWNDTETALIAIMDPEDAMKIVNNIFKELNAAGYEIKKKPSKIKKKTT